MQKLRMRVEQLLFFAGVRAAGDPHRPRGAKCGAQDAALIDDRGRRVADRISRCRPRESCDGAAPIERKRSASAADCAATSDIGGEHAAEQRAEAPIARN